MKKLLLTLAIVLASSSAFARYENCDPHFKLSMSMSDDEIVDMIRTDMSSLAKSHIETEMVYEIDYNELVNANYTVYCTDIGKTNKIIYYMYGNLEGYEVTQGYED